MRTSQQVAHEIWWIVCHTRIPNWTEEKQKDLIAQAVERYVKERGESEAMNQFMVALLDRLAGAAFVFGGWMKRIFGERW